MAIIIKKTYMPKQVNVIKLEKYLTKKDKDDNTKNSTNTLRL